MFDVVDIAKGSGPKSGAEGDKGVREVCDKVEDDEESKGEKGF